MEDVKPEPLDVCDELRDVDSEVKWELEVVSLLVRELWLREKELDTLEVVLSGTDSDEELWTRPELEVDPLSDLDLTEDELIGALDDLEEPLVDLRETVLSEIDDDEVENPIEVVV